MKLKKCVVFAAVILISFAMVSGQVYAGGKGCGKKQGLDDKFYKKAHMILMNQEELGLTDDQAKQIKDLKINTKKSVIKTNAEIELITLDAKVLLYEDKIDTKKLDALIDKKYDIKKEKAKTLVQSMATLKGFLTPEQMSKLKELYKQSACQHSCSK